MNDFEQVTILRQARTNIETFGWCRFTFGSEVSGYCAVGAIRRQIRRVRETPLSGDAYMDLMEEQLYPALSEQEQLYPALSEMAAIIREREQNQDPRWSDFTVVTTWNDANGRTQAEVVALYAEAIRRLEAGASA